MTKEEMGKRVWEYRVPMLRLALSILRSSRDSEDAVSDAVIKAIDGAEGLRSTARLKSWLLAITANCCKTALRKSSREQLTDDYGILDRPIFEDSENGTLYELLCELPEQQAQVLTLYYYENMSAAEIAKVLKIPISTVLMRMKRGREKLKAIYNEEGGRF